MSQTILIADDSKTVRTIVKMAFKASGYDVAEQGEGANVFSTVQNSRPDVLILDYFFPDTDGYDLCREIKENPATADVPVLMLGGKYKQFNEGLARTSGADAVLRKPFKTQALLDAVEEAKANAAKRAPAVKPQAGPPSRPAAAPATPAAGARFGAPQAAPPTSGFGAGSAPSAPQPTPSASALRSPGGYAGVGTQQNRQGFGTGAHPAAEDPAEVASPFSAVSSASAAPSAPAAAPPVAQPMHQAAPVGSGSGLAADQIREIVREEIAAFVKDELPTLVQNVLGGPIQRKLLYKMIARADERYDEVVRGAVHNQVIIEIEKLLNETN